MHLHARKTVRRDVFDVQLRRKDLNPHQKISEKTIGFQCLLVGLTSMKLQSGMAVRLLGGKFFWSCNSSWWLNQPIWKICTRQIGSNFPDFRDENSKNIWETPPSRFFLELRFLVKRNDASLREGLWKFFRTMRALSAGTWKIALNCTGHQDSPQNNLFFLSRSVITKQETCPVMTPRGGLKQHVRKVA